MGCNRFGMVCAIIFWIACQNSTELPYKEYDGQTATHYTPYTVIFVDWHLSCSKAIKSLESFFQHHPHFQLRHGPRQQERSH